VYEARPFRPTASSALAQVPELAAGTASRPLTYLKTRTNPPSQPRAPGWTFHGGNKSRLLQARLPGKVLGLPLTSRYRSPGRTDLVCLWRPKTRIVGQGVVQPASGVVIVDGQACQPGSPDTKRCRPLFLQNPSPRPACDQTDWHGRFIYAPRPSHRGAKNAPGCRVGRAMARCR